MYIPGNYWMIDPITGGKFRVSEFVQAPTKGNDNTGDWVWKGAVDPVHPQEYVVGVEDDPSVPISLPGVVTTMGETTVQNNVYISTNGLFFVPLTVSEDDPVGLVMDNGIVFWSFAQDVEALTKTPLVDFNGRLVLDSGGNVVLAADPYSGTLVTLGSYVHYGVSQGNAVYLPALDNEEWQ